MRVLLTSASSRTAEMVANQLKHLGHELKLTDVVSDEVSEIISCDLNHDSATDDLIADVDAIVHIGYEGYSCDDPSRMIDYHTRGTYNLLWAAAESDVSRVVNISTLRLMESYEENLVVTENWRSLPPAGDTGLLCAHLCEIVCKEFARDRMATVVNLRLGWPIVNGGRDSARESGESAVVCAIDVGKAIDAALSAEVEQWQDVHIQSPLTRQRYLTTKAESLLKFM